MCVTDFKNTSFSISTTVAKFLLRPNPTISVIFIFNAACHNCNLKSGDAFAKASLTLHHQTTSWYKGALEDCNHLFLLSQCFQCQIICFNNGNNQSDLTFG